MDSFARRFERARIAAGLDQSEIARALGITASAVNQWATQDRKPSMKRLIRVAELLQVTPEWLLDGGEGGPVNDAEVALLQMFRQLAEADRDHALRLMRALSAESRLQMPLEFRETTAAPLKGLHSPDLPAPLVPPGTGAPRRPGGKV